MVSLIGDPGSISGSERSTGEGIGHPLQYSWAPLVAYLVKKSTCNVGDCVREDLQIYILPIKNI